MADVLDTQGFANGPPVAKFEAELAQYLGVKHVVAVNTGTIALQAALLGLHVGPGDDVVTVAHTWISTCWAISYVGARPVFADVDEATNGMDPRALEKVITSKTKAIMPVHLHGHPVDLDAILEIARKKGVPVIEDTAQSIGSTYKGKQTGGFGHVNATSFYPSKNLGAAGEGGAVMTNDDAIAERIKRLRDHAQQGRHHHTEIGYNWRMDGVQGAVLRVKLPHLDRWNERRRAIAARYLDGLRGAKGLRVFAEQPWAKCNWHVYPVFHERRDELRAALECKGVATGVHYPTPVHLQPAYAHLGLKQGALPVSERLAATEVSLPMFAELSDAAVDETIAAVRAACAEL
ncbi:MAG: DegT/DnrJ/EryC1/StrS family aminotransferase [Deltaproteobacteria bacterium]|nr:DegT/DnrJ/EryC1/StrS family aminotransferase [Deltaproteobacteria bacterium]